MNTKDAKSQKNGNRNKATKTAERRLVVEMEKAEAAPIAKPVVVAEPAIVPQAAPAPVVLAAPVSPLLTKVPTRAPVGFWIRANTTATAFGVGRYADGAKTQTGPILESFATRELALAYAIGQKLQDLAKVQVKA